MKSTHALQQNIDLANLAQLTSDTETQAHLKTLNVALQLSAALALRRQR